MALGRIEGHGDSLIMGTSIPTFWPIKETYWWEPVKESNDMILVHTWARAGYTGPRFTRMQCTVWR
jgi:hypothetical protein